MSKCYYCYKKNIYEFICKCGKQFCISHRYPEIHKCTYNYKENNKRKLQSELDNSQIKKNKISKI